MKNLALMLVLFGAVGSASAVELVTNGNFETQDSGGSYGAAWDVTANFTFPDNAYFFDEWFDTPGGEISGASAFLNFANNDDVTMSQEIDTADFTAATLSFNLYSSGVDFTNDPPFDYLQVSFGGVLIDTIDLGSADDEEFLLAPSYDLTPYFTGGLKTLEFHGVNDDSLSTDLLIDNVSINATASAVPEPATMAALSIGALALLRRRKKA